MRDFWVNPIPANDTISISTAQAVMVFAPGTNKIWEIARIKISHRGNLNQQMAGWGLRAINVSTGGTNIVGDTTPANRIRAEAAGVQSAAPFVAGDGGIFTHGADNAASAFSGTLADYLGPQQDVHVQGALDWVPTTTSGRLIELTTATLAALCLTSAPAAAIIPVISVLIRVRG